MPLPPFLKRVNFNGEVSNKRPSRISHKEGERNDAYCNENAMFISMPLEVYNFEHRFSQNVIKHGCISLSFLQLVV